MERTVGSRRTVTLVVAVVMGALASLLAFTYLNGAQQRANRGAKLTDVYVVKKPVAKGESGAQALAEGAIGRGSVPTKYRPVTAIVSPGEISGGVAEVDLAPNQIVVQGLFAAAGSTAATNSRRLDPGMVAVAVSTDGVRGLGGLLTPGDTVDIMTPIVLSKARLSPATQVVLKDAVDGDRGWALLYQNVKVLFIGTTPAPTPGDAKTAAAAVAPPGGMITFAVPPEAAMRIVFAANDPSGGGLYLMLVRPDNVPTEEPPVVSSNKFGPPCQSVAPNLPAGCIPLTPYPPSSGAAAKP